MIHRGESLGGFRLEGDDDDDDDDDSDDDDNDRYSSNLETLCE